MKHIYLVICMDFHSDKNTPVRSFLDKKRAYDFAFNMINGKDNKFIYAVEEVEHVD